MRFLFAFTIVKSPQDEDKIRKNERKKQRQNASQPCWKCDEEQTKCLHTISTGLKYIIEFMYLFLRRF